MSKPEPIIVKSKKTIASLRRGEKQKARKIEDVKSADKKPETYTKSDGKRGVRMVPVDKEIITDNKHKKGKKLSAKDKARALASPANRAMSAKQVKKDLEKKNPPPWMKEDFDFKVNIDGFPEMFMSGNSPGEVKAHLRKLVKQPSMIQSVDRVTKHDKKKHHRDKVNESLEEASKTVQSMMKIVDKKQAMKIDGVMVDMFTASAVTQIYNKVNDANKAKMDKMKATQLANVAMKMLKRESVEEGMKYTHAAIDKSGKVIGMASQESDAKDMARRNNGRVVKLKKPMSDKKGDMMINRQFKESLQSIDEAVNVMKELNLDEGKMKQLHQYMDQGKSAAWIAAKMKLDLKTVKALIGEQNRYQSIKTSIGNFLSRVKNKVMGNRPTGTTSRANLRAKGVSL